MKDYLNVIFAQFSYTFLLQWTPEGRRLVTGASSGEFTLWNGLTFNFETILQVNSSIKISVYFLRSWEHVLGKHLHPAHHEFLV